MYSTNKGMYSTNKGVLYLQCTLLTRVCTLHSKDEIWKKVSWKSLRHDEKKWFQLFLINYLLPSINLEIKKKFIKKNGKNK